MSCESDSRGNIPGKVAPDEACALVNVPGDQVDLGLVRVELVSLLVLQIEVFQHHTGAV